MNIVPDTSVVVDGRVSERVERADSDEVAEDVAEDFTGATVFVPETVVGELESQANSGREIGWRGLEELQRLADLADAGKLSVEYVGRRATGGEIERARSGEIDAIIRDVAQKRDAMLVTSDIVQSEVAKAKGIETLYLEPYDAEIDALAVEQYFDDETMSVHLKVDARPHAKVGSVDGMTYEPIGEETLEADALREYVGEIRNAASASDEGFVELDEPGMTIVQFRNYRIAIAEPPFSDGIEITAVRPLVKTEMADYTYHEELEERLMDKQRGVLIAGAPGAGKSTLAQAVAEFLNGSGFSVKTMEKPRDLQVGPDITQYTELGGDMDKTADSLLMVRPDYTIYDEVRKTSDFRTFADMRLAGVGMVGVVHATRAIDALQRLVGRVELGLIPQVVDTVAYVDAGDIHTIYDVSTEVKVPHGLMEEDLARPTIVIRDYETGTPVYEIYTFNRQVVTVPIGEGGGPASESGVDRIAKAEIEREIRSIAHGHVDVEIQSANRAVVYVDDGDISSVIGKGGGRISSVEDRLGISIDVRTHDERPDRGDRATGGSGSGPPGGSGDAGDAGAGPGGFGAGGADGGAGGGGGTASPPAGEVVTPEITNRHVVVPAEDYAGDTVEVQADGDYLFTATVSRGGEIQVSRGSAIAEEMENAIDRSKQITIVRT